VKPEYEEVWECEVGHRYNSPKGIKLTGVTCPTCSKLVGPTPRITDGAKRWRMKKVLVRSVNGRMVAA
jgi:hypothetical protein